MSAPLSLQIPRELVEEIAQRAAAILAEQQPQAPASPWLSTTEAAEYLRAPKSRVFDLTSQGRLRVHKDGARNLYRREDLDAYLQRGGAS
jgi:excisionase family DNA binding protein